MSEGDISTALSYPWGSHSDYFIVESVFGIKKKTAIMKFLTKFFHLKNMSFVVIGYQTALGQTAI